MNMDLRPDPVPLNRKTSDLDLKLILWKSAIKKPHIISSTEKGKIG